jgi:hypothetical protein
VLNRVALMSQGKEFWPEGCMGLMQQDKGLDGLMAVVRPARQVRRSF